MSERITTGYERLFEVRLLHHYWLDEGKGLFDPTTAIGMKRLLDYDVRNILSVAPTAATEACLKNLGWVFKNTGVGFVVDVPKEVPPLSDVLTDMHFDFVVAIQSAEFFNYTALTLRSQKIVEGYCKPEDKTYRYRENMFVFSNRSGNVMAGALFLSKPTPSFQNNMHYDVEGVLDNGVDTFQAVRDTTFIGPADDWQKISDAAGKVVYVHQDDSPVVVLPAGMDPDVKVTHGMELTPDIPDNTFALIRIERLNDGDALGLFSSAGKINHVVYEIHFRNRSTFWTYYDKNTGEAKGDAPLVATPLTFFGNANSTRKPSAGVVKPMLSGTQVTKLISEIFE